MVLPLPPNRSDRIHFFNSRNLSGPCRFGLLKQSVGIHLRPPQPRYRLSPSRVRASPEVEPSRCHPWVYIIFKEHRCYVLNITLTQKTEDDAEVHSMDEFLICACGSFIRMRGIHWARLRHRRRAQRDSDLIVEKICWAWIISRSAMVLMEEVEDCAVFGRYVWFGGDQRSRQSELIWACEDMILYVRRR
jgi:hypothetical protein